MQLSKSSNLTKGDLVTINGYEGVFETIGITGQGRIRFLNRQSGERVLLPSFSVDQFVQKV